MIASLLMAKGKVIDGYQAGKTLFA
jgi:hypothetical protein